MSFSPLPKNFTDHLSALDPASDAVLELGSGEGRLSARIAELAGGCVRLERRRPQTGVVCDLVGDARFPPVRQRSLAVVVAANLVRHLRPRQRLGEWLESWRRLLRPDGALYILEDDPDPTVPAQRNFRDLQRFLARLLPESRGTLLGLNRFRESVASGEAAAGWTFGYQQNGVGVDPTEVLRLLSAGQGRVTGAEAALSEAISRDGIAPGRYWWARAEAPGDEVER